jgi:hypothetical protein
MSIRHSEVDSWRLSPTAKTTQYNGIWVNGKALPTPVYVYAFLV